MSAAATAAGYLYASGRLRGRREGEEGDRRPEKKAPREQSRRREIRVAVVPPRDMPSDAAPAAQEKPAPRRVPKIEYRTRRWRPDGQ